MTGTFVFSRIASPVGEIIAATRGDVVAALDFHDFEPRLLKLLERRFPGARLVAGPAPAALTQALARYFDGDLAALDAVEVEMGGTAFQRNVWTALRRIPAGETRSYGALAAEIGRPTAVRAVGLANGSNPIGVIVPCHRVIGANGALTGYAGGLDRKRRLLTHEGAGFRDDDARAPRLL